MTNAEARKQLSDTFNKAVWAEFLRRAYAILEADRKAALK